MHVNSQTLTYDFEGLVGKTKKFGILHQCSLKLKEECSIPNTKKRKAVTRMRQLFNALSLSRVNDKTNNKPQLPQTTINFEMAYFDIQIATSGKHTHIHKKPKPSEA